MDEMEQKRRIAKVATAVLLAALVEEFQDETVAQMGVLVTKHQMLLAPMAGIPPIHSALALSLEAFAHLAGVPVGTREEKQALVERVRGWTEIFDAAAEDAHRSMQLAGEA